MFVIYVKNLVRRFMDLIQMESIKDYARHAPLKEIKLSTTNILTYTLSRYTIYTQPRDKRLKYMIKQRPIKWKSTLKDWLLKDLEIKPARTDGIIYKRFPQNKTGKFTKEEMDYLIANQIPF